MQAFPPVMGKRVICTAIATTKIPILLKSGFWRMEDAARTDYSMLFHLRTNEEIEQTLQSWLVETIQRLEGPSEQPEKLLEGQWLPQAA